MPLKIARLFLLSDLLHNSTAPVRNASRYRTKLQVSWGLLRCLAVPCATLIGTPAQLTAQRAGRLTGGRASPFSAAGFVQARAWRTVGAAAPVLTEHTCVTRCAAADGCHVRGPQAVLPDVFESLNEAYRHVQAQPRRSTTAVDSSAE